LFGIVAGGAIVGAYLGGKRLFSSGAPAN